RGLPEKGRSAAPRRTARRTRRAAAAAATRARSRLAPPSQLDVAIEPFDPRGPVFVDLWPVLILQLGRIVLRFRPLFDDLAFERDLGVGRDHPVGRALHVLLHFG